ncbi:MAG: hypothetical protein Q7K57_02375 [Burkholderiaceae bacterium]|nr:hypothetical protein [Burkholderiaceae bacterium]
MAKDRAPPPNVPSWSRLVEWSLLAGVIVVLGLVFARQMRVLQGQAELAAVKTTLGALRTTLVIDHLQKTVVAKNSSMALVPRNPFELLQRQPVNYRGEMTPAAAAAAPAGSWVFDPVCTCVGYLPIYAQWFDSPSGDVMAWYRVSGAPGPLQLTAKEAYVWQGQVMN